ncbi:MAG: exodeoxyribonuclease V subunit gamma, partial [Kiritimatiellae bacterium]|nr:exodeoxyribonuclease V subunit gamma [Kiritimatiellia bacterium]
MSIIFGDGWEGLGEAFARRWEEERRGAGPFGRSVLALAGKGRGAVGWLKGEYLKRPGAFWANLEVMGYGAFIEALKGRKEEGDDPWGAALLPWRVYRLLGERGAEFGPPGGYAAGDGARRWSVAEQVAGVLRGYQRVRPEMLLRRWRGGARPDMDATEAWQAKLWAALGGAEWDGGAKLAPGAMEGVSGVHVFAPPVVARAELALLDALAERVRVTVYAFDPCREMWTDDGPWKARRRAVRELLETGEALPPERGAAEGWDEEAHPLLGTWGLGLRATLGEWIDRAEAGAEEQWAIREGGGTSLLAQVQEQIRTRDADGGRVVAADDASVQLHRCHTPHREMEALRDGIWTWLAHHPDASPADVLVLCGDYEAYVPHIDAVFGESAERLPYTRANLGLRERGGAAEAFRRMLGLADDPFKATEVLDLLGNDAVARRFGLSAEDLEALRGIVAEANIHWGYDASHVSEKASKIEHFENIEPVAPPSSFTWRRGLDRLLLGALVGAPPERREGLVDAGSLGWVLPMGDCEGDRAQAVGRLAEFVDALRRLAGRLAATSEKPPDAEGWRVLLEGVLEEFFREDDDTRDDLSELHRVIAELCRRMAAAG